MSTLGRLKKMKLSIEMDKDKYPQKPDFNSWDLERLNTYILNWHNSFTRENCLSTFEEEEELLTRWLNKGLMTQQEYDSIIIACKEINEQTNAFMSIPANEGGCIVFIDTEKKYGASAD